MPIKQLVVLVAYSVQDIRDIPIDRAPGCEVILWPSQRRYLFNPSSVADDDGATILAPTIPPGACCTGGRWILEVFDSSDVDTDDDSDPDSGSGGLNFVGEAEMTDGDVAISSGASWTVITGTPTDHVDFTLVATTNVLLDAMATAGADFANRSNLQLGIRVTNLDTSTSTDYIGTFTDSSTLGNGEIVPVGCIKGLPLAAANWRIQVIARNPGGGGVTGVLLKNADTPVRLRVAY